MNTTDKNFIHPKYNNAFTVFWNKYPKEAVLVIDHEEVKLAGGEMLFLSDSNIINRIKTLDKINVLHFSKTFYCITAHDAIVGCRGLLFYGSSFCVIKLSNEESIHFESLWEMANNEMTKSDEFKQDTIKILLSLFLISATRIFKALNLLGSSQEEIKIIRDFHFLVNLRFKDKTTVTEYAEMLHKSPKTVSNIFSKQGYKSPSQIIIDRRMLEAKRLLSNADSCVKEIAEMLGFKDTQTFSRFFKKNEKLSPIDFKKLFIKN